MENMSREDLYVATFCQYVYGDLLDKPLEWDRLEERFTEQTGLPANSGLGHLFRGFVIGMTGTEKIFKDTLRSLEESYTQYI